MYVIGGALVGGASDLPIVYVEDYRKSFARHCGSAAVIDLNSDDDFETIRVDNKHIYFMSDWIENQYSARNCQLDNQI